MGEPRYWITRDGPDFVMWRRGRKGRGERVRECPSLEDMKFWITTDPDDPSDVEPERDAFRRFRTSSESQTPEPSRGSESLNAGAPDRPSGEAK